MFKEKMKAMDTKERILAAAMEMFFTMEYNKVTLKAIAEAAGVTKGGIYHYYESKDHLLQEGLKFSFASIMSQMDSMLEMEMSAEDVIRSWFDFEKMMGSYAEVFIGEAATENMLQFMYLMLTAVRKSDEIRKLFGKIYLESIDMVETIFIKAQESGEIRKDLDPRKIALLMITSFEGATLLGGLTEGFEITSLGHDMFETFWNQVKA